MENDEKLKNKNIETFTQDMVKAIEGNEGGLIKKIIHEQEMHEAEKVNLSPKSQKNRLFMIISLSLIILAFAVLIFLAFFYQEINTVPVTPQFSSIIFTEQTNFKAIDGLSKELISALVLDNMNNSKIKIGGIESLYLTENSKVIEFKRFISLMKSDLTSGRIGLFSDNFLLGAFKSGISSVSPDVGNPFILLGVRSFSDVFPVMRVWEDKMLYDLRGLFRISISPETNYLFTKDWEEGIIANKNARILKGNSGKMILAYIFVDDSYIQITDSELTAQEVILSLASSKIKK